MKDSITELLKPRTIFAMMFYATFCSLILHKADIPPELNTIISMLMGFWFGNKNKQGDATNDENK